MFTIVEDLTYNLNPARVNYISIQLTRPAWIGQRHASCTDCGTNSSKK